MTARVASQRPLRLAEDVALRESRRPGPGGWASGHDGALPEVGTAISVELEPAVAEFVGSLDGAKAIEVEPDFRPTIRRLAELGFLELGEPGKI